MHSVDLIEEFTGYLRKKDITSQHGVRQRVVRCWTTPTITFAILPWRHGPGKTPFHRRFFFYEGLAYIKSVFWFKCRHPGMMWLFGEKNCDSDVISSI
ncbi:hypothetical protein AVEN_188397-1 [Araneus ventricosus]|uniref:Uncharacterized protein n=1 Tax=Araneus ventricosus TaxID=182803 RepID=A0A4Y2EA53_ARAVE|nr:hypothetical protein AVEN_188397-1 [Araneus ventricosus]